MDNLYTFLVPVLGALPFLFVAGVGILMALTRWRRHPRVSLFATCGLALIAVVSVGSAVFYGMVPRLTADLGSGGITAIMSTFTVITRLLSAAGWSLILVAVFIDRRGASA